MNRLAHLTKDITSYDLLKTFAVIFMLIDHTGHYFFEGDLWWRVAGRMCVPVWFFLIGYARSRDLGPRLWVGAVVLVLVSGVTGENMLPVNILGTMLVVRLVIDQVMLRSQAHEQALWQVSVFLFLLSFPTSYLFEYGSLAIIMAMFGWLVRHQYEYPQGVQQTHYYFFFAYAAFIFLQVIAFDFRGNEVIVLAGGILAIMFLLMFFRPVTFPGTGQGVKGVLLAPVRFMGRWTLEIYVVHLVFLKFLGSILYPDRFVLFSWRLLPVEVTSQVFVQAVSGGM